ncbi:hypothetical protein HU200_022430 [Digitaria exilis]|uniref:Cytochrome b5 heme-binding domain-containing protein n=1 Tax=Digitaria exilis TaxID=1010633 RepID=A0A835EXL1_9POAL|nr:hypothetical protein HU200_022430 [Digitaria exilis]
MASCSVFTPQALSTSAPSSRRRAATAAVCLPVLRRSRLASRGVRCSAGQGGVKVPAKRWVQSRCAAPSSAPSAGDQTAPPPLVPEPVQVGEITEEELRQYDGSDPEKPLLMAIKGQIYDVSQSRMFYGPGGSYALFAGKDASRALAKMSFEPQDLNGDISDLTPMELGSLNDWEYKFTSKYVKVGTIRSAAPTEEAYASISPETQEEVIVPISVLQPDLDPEPEPIDDDTP